MSANKSPAELFKRSLACVVFAMVLMLPAAPALACVPMSLDGSAFTAPVAADQMVAEAASIEVMRVTARTVVNGDPTYAEMFVGGPYRFTLETVMVLKGFRRHALIVHGFGTDTYPHTMPNFRFRRLEALWWTGDEGYTALQDTTLLDPEDSGSIACANTLIFDVGDNYLVFRDRDGNLLRPAYRSTGRPARPRQRPIIEQLHGASDPWLAEVRRAIAEQGARPANFWDILFSLVFGDRNGADVSAQRRTG